MIEQDGHPDFTVVLDIDFSFTILAPIDVWPNKIETVLYKWTG